MRFSFGGEDKTGMVAVPSTGGLLNFTTVTIAQDVQLTQGVQQVKIDLEAGGGLFTFDNFSMTDLAFGDFNGDGSVNCDDLDSFVGNMGSEATGVLASLDLNLNGEVDDADAALHIAFLIETSNGVAGTFLGDLNCDGQVDVLGDAFTLIGNLNSSVSRYVDGDLNFDGTVSVLGDAFVLISNLGLSNSN